ncbi:MAG: TetR/AcrR family transcriptional regulator [Candidatus Dormibacteria bacterium]
MIVAPGPTEGRPYRMVARAAAAEATVSRLLEVAVDLFTEKPYDDVSLDEIASLAGVTKRTLLRRFGSKEALFVAAMEGARKEMISLRGTTAVGDIPAAVAGLLDQYERWGANRLRMLSQEDRIPVITEHVKGGRRWHWQWVERTFAPLIRNLERAPKKRRIASIVAITDVYTWKLLRRDLGLSRADTELILVDLITRLQGEN